MTQYAAVVDPLSTGQEYPAVFRAAGVECIAVLSGVHRMPLHTAGWHPERFAAVVDVEELGVEAAVARLRELAPICLIPGCEAGVALYERLLPQVLPGTGNDPDRAMARRDKWQMAQALIAANVPHLRQICSADPEEIAKWIADSGLADADLVVKPPMSGATDEVHLVAAGADWRPLVDRIVGRLNVCGVIDEAALVQEFADGDEYLVDSYSVDGRHGLVDVCRYTKGRRGDRIGIYDRVDFLPPEHPDVHTVWQYTTRVLDAVGVLNGCGHTEVMLTAQGPRLLEIGERPAGGGHQTISELATGDNHLLRTVAHRVHGRFTPRYELLQHVRGVFVSAPAEGVWTNAKVFDGIDRLPTFWSAHLPKGSGETVAETVDLLTALGWVILAGPDEAAIDADYREIRAREARIEIRRG